MGCVILRLSCVIHTTCFGRFKLASHRFVSSKHVFFRKVFVLTIKMANGDVKTEEITETLKNDTEEKSETVKDAAETKTATEVKSEVKAPLSKELEAQIIRQIEYYFGDINLPRDKFLKEQVTLDDGWVPLTVLLTFKRLHSLCPDADVIAQVMLDSKSTLIEVSDDRTKLRRDPSLVVPQYNDERRKELMGRTAYAKGFPKDETLENVIKYFTDNNYAQEAVTMRTYFDRATKVNIFKGSVFVIFKELEMCKKFIETEDLKYGDTPLLRMWQSDYVEMKKQEREEKNLSKKKGKNAGEDKKAIEARKHKFPKGAIVHMDGFTQDDTTRETIKKKVTEIAGTEPAFITFTKGDKSGYIRFSEENGATEFASKVTDNKFEIEGDDITVRVLEGDEEEQFLVNLSETLGKMRHHNKNKGKGGRKRKGFGDSGPRAKQERRH